MPSLASILNQTINLPEEEQLRAKSILTDVGLYHEIHGGDLQDILLAFINKAKDLHYKTRQALMKIWENNLVDYAIVEANNSYIRYAADKKEIDRIEDEIHRFFKPKGWFYEHIKWQNSRGINKDVPFYIKSVKRDGLVYRDCVMVGVENMSNDYLLIRFVIDEIKQEQVGKEEVIHFKTFQELKNFITLPAVNTP